MGSSLELRKSEDNRELYTNSRYNKDLLKTGTFGDCTVCCRNRSWRTHRNILSPRCSFFNACFSGLYKESLSDANEVQMDDDDPDAVEGLLYYLYMLEYPNELGERSLSGGGIQPSDAYRYWNFDLLIYRIADKYNLPELVRLAQQSLLEKAKSAQSRDEDGNQNIFSTYLDGFVALIDELYAPDKRLPKDIKEIRDQVVTSTSKMVAQSSRDPRLSELIATVSEFALDLIEALSECSKRPDFTTGTAKDENVVESKLNHIPMNEDSDSESG